MTLQAVAGFLGQAGIQHPAMLYRNFVSAMGGRRSGAIRYDDFVITPSASAMSITVGRGDAVLMGTEGVSTQGAYYVWNNATETIAMPAAAANPRYDSLILRVIDTDYGSDPAGSKATWEVVSGTPAGSPTPVADSAFAAAGAFYHPGAWLRVADILVPASVTNLSTATVVNKRKYARVGRHTMVLAADYPADAVQGDTVTQLDGTDAGLLFHYNGSAWHQLSMPAWQNFTPTLYNNVNTTPASIAYTLEYAKYVKLGKTVHAMASVIATPSSSTNGVGLSLPLAAATRYYNIGSSAIIGTSAPAGQVGIALMGPNAGNNIVLGAVSTGGAFLDLTAASQRVRYSVTYDVP